MGLFYSLLRKITPKAVATRLGYRWSLYIARNEKELIYAMHCHSAQKIAGYLMRYFANGGSPIEPWSLYLNFNHTNQLIKLEPDYFASDGYFTQPFIRQIESIDPKWDMGGEEPIFEEAATRKSLNFQESDESFIQSMYNPGNPQVVTYYSVMNSVFGKL